MSRYYFHVRHGTDLTDDDGTDLESADAARVEASKLIGQLVVERPEDLWLDGHCTVTVMDETGLTLFMLDLAVITSPAAPPCGLSRR